MTNFIHSIQSEAIKTKRTSAVWLALAGGLFIPAIFLFAHLKNHTTINQVPLNVNGWTTLFLRLWQNMAVFLLPMGVVLAGSLITQIEYKNNTWKQVHASPQSFTNIFFAKFSIMLTVIISFFVIFNLGIILTGIIPSLVTDHKFPRDGIPYMLFLKGNIKFFITILPVLALQYLISLKFKNFLVPVGIGFLGLIGTIMGKSWEYIYLSPFSYSFYLGVHAKTDFNIYTYSIIYFLLLMSVSYILYLLKKEKG